MAGVIGRGGKVDPIYSGPAVESQQFLPPMAEMQNRGTSLGQEQPSKSLIQKTSVLFKTL